jgi:hypothetical protein
MASGKDQNRKGAKKVLLLTITARILNFVVCEGKLTSWRGPTSFVSGVPPQPRDCHGLAAVLDNLYVFGGNSGTGGNMSAGGVRPGTMYLPLLSIQRSYNVCWRVYNLNRMQNFEFR